MWGRALIGDTLQIKFEFGWRGKNRSSRRKTSRSKDDKLNKLNPDMTPSPEIESEPHWWEASALTTAPSLLPQNMHVLEFQDMVASDKYLRILDIFCK